MIRVLIILLLSCSLAYAGLDFDDTDDLITNANVNELNGVTEYSCSAWARIDSGGSAGSYRFIVKGDNSGNELHWFWFGYDGSTEGAFAFQGKWNTTNGQWATDDDAYTHGDWHHFGFSYSFSSTSNDPVFYIDGVSVNVTESSTPAGTVTSDDNNIYIGNRPNESRPFDGAMSDVACWDTILTAGEMALLGKSRVKGMPLQVDPSNLQMYLPLDDLADGAAADGVTLEDRSSNGNDGTGDDGTNNSGMTAVAEVVLSYP